MGTVGVTVTIRVAVTVKESSYHHSLTLSGSRVRVRFPFNNLGWVVHLYPSYAYLQQPVVYDVLLPQLCVRNPQGTIPTGLRLR